MILSELLTSFRIQTRRKEFNCGRWILYGINETNFYSCDGWNLP